ncbi:hypothetical protein ES703_79677 [subsurface metagenome]
MGDFAGEFQLIPETLDHLFISRDLRSQELQCHLLLDFFIEYLVDPAHSSSSQLFDDMIPSGE